jgi:hypothetical protein
MNMMPLLVNKACKSQGEEFIDWALANHIDTCVNIMTGDPALKIPVTGHKQLRMICLQRMGKDLL